MPLVCARFVHQHAGCIRLRRILQVIVEERLHHRPPEPGRGVAFEMNLADTAAFAPCLTVVPGSQNQMHHFARRVLARQRLIERGSAVNILLIEEAADDQHRHSQRLFGQQLVHGLFLPERIVGGVVRDGAPKAKLLESAGSRYGAGGTGSEVLIVGVANAGPPLLLGLPHRFLIVNVIKGAVLPKGAVVKPVVPDPAVHHRREGHGHLERRVRMHR